MKKSIIHIEGMSCQHCIHAVRKELSALNGVVVQDVRIGLASIEYDEGAVTPADLRKAVENAGYRITGQN